MNEQELKTYCREHAGEPMPPEARALLERDPALRAEVERLARVAALMGLKRYETPHPSALPRCMAAVEARIAAGEGESILERMAALWSWKTTGALAGAAVLLAVTVVGLTGQPVEDGAGAVVAEIPAAAVPEVMIERVVMVQENDAAADDAEAMLAGLESPAPMPTFEKPLIVLQVSSNPQPSRRLEFGPGNTVPVNFEY
jgi:hypothetical protein